MQTAITLTGCVDCLFFAANGDVEDDETRTRLHYRFSQWEDDGYIIMPGDTDLDTAFSRQPCECCGDTLAGERFGLVGVPRSPGDPDPRG